MMRSSFAFALLCSVFGFAAVADIPPPVEQPVSAAEMLFPYRWGGHAHSCDKHSPHCSMPEICEVQPVVFRADVGDIVSLNPVSRLLLSENHDLAVSWRWAQRPDLSVADFSSADALRPSVTLDLPGTYVAIADFYHPEHGPEDVLQSVEIRFGTENLPPLAQIDGIATRDGADQISLSAAASSDVDGDTLSYSWSVVKGPEQSTANLSATDGPTSSMQFDLRGAYVLGLSVQDETGQQSALACYNAWFDPDNRPAADFSGPFDVTLDNGGATYYTYALGDVTADNATTRVVQQFNVKHPTEGWDTGVSVLNFIHRGDTYFVGETNEFLWLVHLFETDEDPNTRALISNDPANRDLTLIFEAEGSSITIRDIIGPDLRRAHLIHAGAAFYDPLEIRHTNPVADLMFEDRLAEIGETVSFTPYGSTDIDGDILAMSFQLVARPNGSEAELTVLASGVAEFTPDLAGEYLLRLRVDDGIREDLRYAFVTVGTPRNLLPVARAVDVYGVSVGELAELDGSQSYDLNGDLLSYDWSLISRPAGSSAALTDDASPIAGLTPDVDGVYIVELIVSDANSSSDPVTLVLDSLAPRPLAEAGSAILRSGPGDVTLSGFATTQGAPSYEWSMTGLLLQDEGVSASGLDGAAPVLSFETETTSAIAQLTVSDVNGISYPDIVFVGSGNQHPVLSAPTALTGSIGAALPLDGASFASDPNGDVLSYRWSLLYRPASSTADFPTQQVEAATTSFTPDREGLYLLQLEASDSALDAEPLVIALNVGNSAPIADAGADFSVFVGEAAALDGSASSDPDGDQLFFTWSLTTQPAGSSVVISDSSEVIASLIPDRSGVYEISLTVSDGSLSSAPSTLTLTVPNRDPVAQLNGPATALIGEVVSLSALGSSDPDGDALTYSFTLVSAPTGSAATLSNAGAGQAEITPDLGGTYEVSVSVSDGSAQAQASLSFAAESFNSAPALGSLQSSYTVEVGHEFNLQLAATDVNGDPLSYFAGPLPLPNGFTLDAATGLLSFDAQSDLIGETLTLNLGVSDGVLTDSVAVDFSVVAADDGATAVSGRVLDAVDYASGVETPLANMPIRLEVAGISATTAADGSFRFDSLSAGVDRILVEPSATGGPGGYLGSSRPVQISENLDQQLQPVILLAPLDEGCATPVAGQETVLVGTSSGVEVRIPADSIETTAGTAYGDPICLGSLPQLFDDGGFEDGTQACQIYALDAPGATFTQGFSVTAPNADLLPAGARLRLMSRGFSAQRFSRAASATVDAGAATVGASVSQFSDGAQFSFLPIAPRSVASADQSTGNNSLSPLHGDLSETYTLTSYQSFGRDQGLGLSYHSTAADPTVIVAGDVLISADSGLPIALRSRIDVGGLSINDEASWDPRNRADGYSPALLGEEVELRQSVSFDASGLASGNYEYRFYAQAEYACSTVSSSHASNLSIHNETDSPYGIGWSIDELQQLVVAPDGTVSIIDDDDIVVFDPEPTLTNFEAQPLVFDTLGSRAVLARDFDGDGDLDLAYTNSGTGSVNFITNFGDRDLQYGEQFVIGDPNYVPINGGSYSPNLATLAAGDLRANGRDDVAFGLIIENTLGYLANEGFGSFSPANIVEDFRAPIYIAVEDMDQDGHQDVVFATVVGGFIARDEIWIAYGDSMGGWQGQLVLYRSFGDHPRELSVADIDGDGQLDIAVRTRESMFVTFATGPRSYTSASQEFGQNGVTYLGEYFDLLDADLDGDLDLIWSGENTLQLYLNDGGRSYPTAIDLPRPPGSSRYYVFAVDANGDGIDDLFLSNNDEVHTYSGDGQGGFLPFESGTLGYEVQNLAIADIDGDGSLDLVSVEDFFLRVHFSRPSDTGNFVARDGEFSQLARLPSGGWERRYPNGTVIEFNAQGLQTAEVDTQGNRREFTYGANGELLTITDQAGGITEFIYDAQNRLTLIRYPDGRETEFEYNLAENTLSGVYEPGGGEVSFGYDDEGRLVTSTNQNGNSNSYSYDATGRLTGGTMADGSSIHAQVAASLGLVDGLGGQLPDPRSYVAPDDRATTITDRNGQVSHALLNEFGSIIQITDPLGRVTRMERNSSNLVTRVERPIAGGQTRIDLLEYDGRGNVTRVVEAFGSDDEREMRYEYEPQFSQPIRIVDADGFATRYEYDANGEVTRITDALSGERLFTYTVEGQLASRTDENGNTTSFEYDADLNLSRITYADGTITVIEYDGSGNPTAVSEANGTAIERQIHRTYDAMNRVLSVEIAAADGTQIGGTTSYAYDLGGNLTTITDATGLVTTMSYDGMERLISVDDPARGLIQRVYNQAGQLIQQIDAEGATYSYGYDAFSRLIQTTDPDGGTSSFAYDDSDNIITVTDARGGTTAFTYDPLDRLLTRTDPLGQTITRTYDDRGNLISMTRENGQTETAGYDGLSRRISVQYSGALISYAYDPRGNLTLAEDSDSRVTFTYDNRNRLATTTTDGTVGPQPTVTLTYAYDALDRRISLSDSLGGTTSYAYDAEDRLTQLTAPWAASYDFGYDGEGRRISLTSSTGRSSTMSYTGGLLTSLTHLHSAVPLVDLDYEYSADGQLTQILDALAPAESLSLDYDTLDRLVLVSEGVPASQGGTPIPIEDYAWDAEGNRLASHLSGLYSSNAHHQLLEDDDYTYAYDTRGNRVSRTSKADGTVETYYYDQQNRLTGYARPGVGYAYAYDALDRRIAIDRIGGGVTSFVYDPWSVYAATANDIAMEFEDGVLERRWLHGPEVDEPLAYERYAGTTAGGSGSAFDLFRNRLGSVVLAVSVATGAVAAEYEYDSFGQRTEIIATEEVRYGYTSREHDPQTGLMHYRARAYDPVTGTFLQRDPIGFASGALNLYSYVSGDPYNFTDPSGLTSSEYGGLSNQNAQTSRAATASVGRGVMGLANNLSSALRSSTSARALLSQSSRTTATSASRRAALRQFGQSGDDLIAAANAPLRGGMTRAGRALSKHAQGQRWSGTFPRL